MSRPLLVRRHSQRPHGLPAPLPPGETLLWQGAPDWRALAVRVMHCRKVACYFAILAVVCTVRGIGEQGAGTAFAVAGLAAMAAVAVGLLAGFALMVGRTTVYTVTDRRVVLRIGVALGITLNLPFTKIDAAALRPYRDGTGDIALRLQGATRIGFATLWPHVRPWRTRPVEPTLRAIRDADRVARLLTDALLAHAAPEAAPGTPAREFAMTEA